MPEHDAILPPAPDTLTTVVAVLRQEVRDLKDQLARERLADKEKLELQAKEYERRLESLNNDRALAVSVQKTYLTLDTYDAAHRELGSKLETAEHTLSLRMDGLAARFETAQLAGVASNSEIRSNAEAIASLRESQTWVVRLVIGLVIVALVALVVGGNVHLIQQAATP